ncbi:response regulator [Pseudochryseolinea flava]|uniref:DNA-binding response regulator n=1 Tax=Pseudochryseolinea flava TaxID=2059302 RepID=A0A364Y582_9BACT|nr:response regulator [Pseudochryseolinea flava]RAW02156.1 DNA-binding response regulator [Pseudochryseolinea flava]
MNKGTILIVDDEVQIRRMLTITLQSNGYNIVEAQSGKDALAQVANHPPDLILLDLGLPDQNGQDVLVHLREWYSNPIIILSVQDSESEIVLALDRGASDYLVKPFRTGELLARIRAAMRKNAVDDHNHVVSFNDLQIDFAQRTVKRSGQLVKLTTTEYSLLILLASNEGKVLTHQYLLQKVWGPSYINESQYLRVFVAQLRKKIEKDANKPAYILTESGVGYRFVGS